MNFNKFIKLADKEYSFLKKCVKRNNNLCGIYLDDLTHLRYKTLKRVVPELFSEAKYELALYEILKDSKKKFIFTRTYNNLLLFKLKKISNFKKYAFLLWVQDQYEVIKNLEQTYLSTPPEPKMLNAGIRDLDVLGDKPMIRTLSMGDMSKEDYILNQPYYRIFDYNLEDTIRYRIAKRKMENDKLK